MSTAEPTLMERLRTALSVLAKALGFASTVGFLRYLVFLVRYKMAQARAKLPLAPGPTPLPLLGSLLEMAKYTGPDGNPLVHVALMEMGRKYKGLFGFYLGNQYTICITKPSVAEEAYMDCQLDNGEMGRGALTTDRAPNQSHGGHHVPTMYIATRDGKGIAMSTGAYWRKVRGRMVAHITSQKTAEKNSPMIKAEVESVVWAWNQKCLRGEKIDDLTAQLKRESMNMAMNLMFSTRWGSEMPSTFRELQHAVEYIFQNLSSGNPSDMIPILRMVPNRFLSDFKKVVERRDELLGKIIADHRREFEDLRAQGKMKTRADARDILDMFFWDQFEGYDATQPDGTTKREKLTADEVHVCIWDILFASTDTTATTNEYMIYHLINNPDVQRKVHEELDRVVGPDRLPSLDDRDKLPYFHAFLFEVFRYRLVSPVMAPHYAVQDITLHDTAGKEYLVPQGTSIFMHGYSMALDPELWDDPHVFNPDRWLTPREKGMDLFGQVKRPTIESYKFIPFSLGPRMCPGYSFAKVAQFIQSATIAHCFDWKLTPDAYKSSKVKGGKLDMTETWGLTIMPQRYGEMGLIAAEPRPAARLCKPSYNDINHQNVFLNREEQKVKLIVRKQLSHDTVLLRFGFGDSNKVLGLPVGKHVKVIVPNLQGTEAGKWNGRDDPEAGKPFVERAYTPTSSDNDPGYIDLLVKVYNPGVVARFPDGGKVSRQLGKMQVGDLLTIKGPFGLIQYMGNSVFRVGRNEIKRRFVGMMAGGSGITPMYQILVASLNDPSDETKYSLIYANQTPQDRLLAVELEDLEKRFPNRFRLHYTVDRAPTDGSWKYSVGFIDAPMIAEHMPPKGPDTLLLACGPPPMVEFAVKQNLAKLGYDKDALAVF